MKTMRIEKLFHKEFAANNCLYHNKGDFVGKEELCLKINNVIYKSYHHKMVTPSTISCSEMIRNSMNVVESSNVNVQEVQIENNKLDKLKITASFAQKSDKNYSSIHEADINDCIKKDLSKHYFTHRQLLLIKMNNICYTLKIETLTNGFITNKTKLDITSNDPNLVIVGSQLLKRDLFKDDYDFANLGIGGLDSQLINIFRRALSTRAINHDIIQKLGIKHSKGLLLYGPPGTGKTLIARKIGSMISNIEPIIVNGPEILNSYVGKSEENVRKLFNAAREDYNINKHNAKLHVIIFDEIDAICKHRGMSANSQLYDGVLNQLLTMIDGVDQFNNFFIIAMTNRKDLIDKALLRSGRIEIHIEINLPDINSRKQIFDIHTKNMITNGMANNINTDLLATLTENYSGADIENVVKNATTKAIHKCLVTDKDNIMVNMDHFIESIKEVTPLLGNNRTALLELVPKNLDNRNEEIVKLISKHIEKNYTFKSFLLLSETKSGKTTILSEVGLDKKCCVKMLRSGDFIGMDDISKCQYLVNQVKEVSATKEALVLLDDIDIICDFLEIGPSLNISNRMYQTLKSILKSNNPNRKMTIIASCSNSSFYELIKKEFTFSSQI